MLGHPPSPRKSSGVGPWKVLLFLLGLPGPAAVAGEAREQVEATLRGGRIELSWSDAEDRLFGAVVPAPARAGQPMEVSLEVTPLHGAPFTGPIQATLRGPQDALGEEQVAQKGARGWRFTFAPRESGPHLLDFRFRTTRHKVARAELLVGPRPIDWRVTLGLAALAALGAAAWLAYRLLGRVREEFPGPR